MLIWLSLIYCLICCSWVEGLFLGLVVIILLFWVDVMLVRLLVSFLSVGIWRVKGEKLMCSVFGLFEVELLVDVLVVFE